MSTRQHRLRLSPRRTPSSKMLSRLTVLSVLFLLGSTRAAEQASDGVLGARVWETLQRGGSVMYVILGVSVIGLALLLEVAFRTRRSAILPPRAERSLRDSGRRSEDRIQVLLKAKKKSCLHNILATGHLWRKGTTEQIQAAIEERVDEMLWQYRRAARPLGILSTLTPLLGLLGTVIGIIQAFDVVSRQGALGDPAALAGGISKALLTTCFGLIVAIPMLLAYHYFSGKAEALLRQCEELVKECLILPPE